MPELYKYRSLQNFANFVDIVIFNRLYAASYTELNDPMEGLYFYDEGVLNRSMISKIKSEKEGLKICSLSKNPNSTLMWSHYADSHEGVVIGLSLGIGHESMPITYSGLSYVQNAHRNGAQETARNILSHKLEAWSYEEEERVFVTNGSYVNINVESVILGSEMKEREQKLVKKLIRTINNNIQVEHSNIDFVV